MWIRIFTKHLISISIAITGLNVYGDAFIMTKAMGASTIAEIFISDKNIRVELEIGLNDIVAFENLLPDDVYQKINNDKKPYIQRVKKFFANDFTIKADGKILKGKIISIGPQDRIKRDPVTGDAITLTNKKSDKVIFAKLEYPLKSKPETLSIKPPFNKNRVAAEIGFITYHNGLHINDFRYLSTEEKIYLSWVDPWHSKFENKYLARKYNQPLSAYLYIEPFEVRKEIIIRPLDVQKYWIDLGLANEKTLNSSDKTDIKKKITDFLITKNPVMIDGKSITPKVDRVNFIRRTLSKSEVIDDAVDIPISSATLGIIFIYPINGLPNKVVMDWELFNKDISAVFSQAADEAGSLPYLLSAEDSKLVWNNYLTKPTIPSLATLKNPDEVLKASNTFWFIKKLFTKSGNINDNEAHLVLLGLLKNIYHAFDYRDESDIYDVLAKSTTGDLLTNIYLETQRSLSLKQQGGAKVRVKKVDIIKEDITNLDEDIGFKARSTWHVTGSVGHWGHIHQRKNEYQAIITVKVIDGKWKITEFDMLDEHRL